MNPRIILVGGNDLGCQSLTYLIEQQHEVALCIVRDDDAGQDRVFPSMRLRAESHGIPVLASSDINSPDVLARVKETNADIVLSLQNNKIFRQEWIDLFTNKLGVVNAHLAPLPRYAGWWPEMWAIWNDEKEFGVTLHYAERKVDAGPIIAQRFFNISEHETRKSLYLKSVQAAFELLKDHLAALLKGKVQAQSQDLSKRTYCKRELPNDGFIDLTWNGPTIDRFVRALTFYPFVGPKIKVNGTILSTVAEDLPFFQPVTFKA